MLTMMDITKNVAPGKYQKLNPLSLYRLVNIVVQQINTLISVNKIDKISKIDRFFMYVVPFDVVVIIKFLALKSQLRVSKFHSIYSIICINMFITIVILIFNINKKRKGVQIVGRSIIQVLSDLQIKKPLPYQVVVWIKIIDYFLNFLTKSTIVLTISMIVVTIPMFVASLHNIVCQRIFIEYS